MVLVYNFRLMVRFGYFPPGKREELFLKQYSISTICVNVAVPGKNYFQGQLNSYQKLLKCATYFPFSFVFKVYLTYVFEIFKYEVL